MGFSRQEYWSGLPFPSPGNTQEHILFYLFIYVVPYTWGFPGSSDGKKNLPAMQKMWFLSLGWEDPLEKKMATHFSILAWRIPLTEEPGRLQSMGLKRV